MKQPELGQKIASVRKTRGLTQEELVEVCNLSVRTLQRIESGEVTPRSYTLRVIADALDFDFMEKQNPLSALAKARLSGWFRWVKNSITVLFNLKTDTMKKVSILAVFGIAIFLGLFAITSETRAQKAEKVKSYIEQTNENYIRWFNTGQIDSILLIYSDNIFYNICSGNIAEGQNELRKQIMNEMNSSFKIISIEVNNLNYSKNVAVERGSWILKFDQGVTMTGNYLSEWNLIDGQWLIVNHMSCPGQ